MTHPQGTTPANPAQGVSEKALEPHNSGDATASQNKYTADLTAAIGAGSTEKLGRFGHHPDPAIDFEVEVESLQARLIDAKAGISKPGTESEKVPSVLEGIQRAMTFRVGGDPSAVRAKQMLREIEADAISAIGAGEQAVAYQWRKRDRVMKHEEVWSYVDYHTGLKIAEHPEKYEVRPLYTHPAPSGQAVAVKPLRWPPECPRGQRVHGRGAPFEGVEYCIAHYGGSHGDDTVYRWAAPKGKWSEAFDSFESAKAASQADYERRILSALAHPAQPGWRDADTAPHNQTVILGWRDWRDGSWCTEIGPVVTGQRFDNGYSTISRHGSATHWLPLDFLPAAPQQGE